MLREVERKEGVDLEGERQERKGKIIQIYQLEVHESSLSSS